MPLVHVYRLSKYGHIERKLRKIKAGAIQYAKKDTEAYKLEDQDFLSSTWWLMGFIPVTVPAVIARESNYKPLKRSVLLGEGEDSLMAYSSHHYGKDLNDTAIALSTLLARDTKMSGVTVIMLIAILALLFIVLF